MDREISKEAQRKEQRKQLIKIGVVVGGLIFLIVVVISMLQTSLKRKDLNISTVDRGVIEVSVSASGKVIPAFEEIINSPINSRIVEVYKRGGDSVDIGTPILKLDLQSAETEYNKQLDEEQMKRLATGTATCDEPQQTFGDGNEPESLPYGTGSQSCRTP